MDDFCSNGIKNYITKAAKTLCDNVEALVALNETLSFCGEGEIANQINQNAISTVIDQKDRVRQSIESVRQNSKNPEVRAVMAQISKNFQRKYPQPTLVGQLHEIGVACDPELSCLSHLSGKEIPEMKKKRLQPILGAA